MPPLDPAEWTEALRRVRAGEPTAAVAEAFGIHVSTLQRRLSQAGRVPRTISRPAGKAQPASPKLRSSVGARSAVGVRRQLVNRLYRAIDTKLKLMERRMNSEITALEASAGGNAAPSKTASSKKASRKMAPKPLADGVALNAADHERETRAFGALVKTINSVRQMQAELDQVATTNATTPADVRLAADADRYRREIAERLAKFVPPDA